MTSILSAISGYFGKSIILGTFLPVVVAVVLSLFFVVPLLPNDDTFLKPLQQLDTQWMVLAVSLLSIVVAGLLYNLNHPLMRLYEGYLWKETWLGRWRTQHFQKEFCSLAIHEKRIASFVNSMDPSDDDFANKRLALAQVVQYFEDIRSKKELPDSLLSAEVKWRRVYSEALDRWNLLRRKLNTEFPGKESLVLPTRLGNVMRSFEFYPHREYGMDAVTLWPRLAPKIDHDFAAVIDDAKTTFDFMLNSSMLSTLMAGMVLILGLVYPTWLGSKISFVAWLFKVSAFLIMGYAFYNLSISRARAWGDLVKSAFDLYRRDLLLQLGYQIDIRNRSDERELWSKISLQILLGDYDATDKSTSEPRIGDYAPKPVTYAKGSPEEITLEVTRGEKVSFPSWTSVVVLRITNTDKIQRVTDVIVTDQLPKCTVYEWDSARIGEDSVEVSGTNPYEFKAGNLEPLGQVTLTYGAIQRRNGETSAPRIL